MQITDPNSEWLGHVQPVGLVVAPSVLARHGLVPQEQTRLDTEEVLPFLSEDENGPAVANPWGFFLRVLGWRPGQVAGAPGGPALPEDLSAWLPESETRLAPDWAVTAPDGGWQLLVQFAARGIDPDTRGALAGWEATPHQRLERLLRETGVPTGLLLTDHELRLVHAPRGETSGWLAFPLRALGSVSGRPMLGGLRLLLSSFRLHNDAAERRLPALLKASRDAQAEVSTKLASQVLGALHELLRGLHEADSARIERLAAQQSAHLYEGLLTVLLRLVFLLYAEDRNLVPSATDAEARALYDNGYGVRALHARLLDDAARQPDTMDERRGAWSRLLALFRLIHAGHHSGWIRGRGGKLFDPAVFPFLQGQDAATDRPAPAPVSDGCILRVLDGLLNLEGERLSYRTLDVEQIGSVYETVMGFTVLTLSGPALAIKAGKNNRTPVFLDLVALGAKKGAERAKFLKEEADRGQLPAKVAQALSAAGDEAIAEALRPIVDERGSPGGRLAAAGTPLLQPTDERRRTGSHYTPRSLTEPIVRHALEPAFERIGDAATPEEVLALKVCDPAMGSGAFLVEACRQLAMRLVRAWARHPGTRPEIAADEDEDLLARRLVAQRCLYGVDRNPLATDLARLSLWLATLARHHEFTFLDHALKTGDSLVGLTRAQIGALTWGDDRQGSLFTRFVAGRVAEAVQARAEIREASDDVARAIQEAKHGALEGRLADVRALGDAVLAAFFAQDKPRAREAARQALEDLGGRNAEAMWAEVRRQAATLGQGPQALRPFHWELEFPEVFAGPAPGFDAIVGNPPFAGKNTLIAGHRDYYLDWLQTLHVGAHGNADLVAHFFRRAFALLRHDGCFGLIATNTIGQGDTRESGLRMVIETGGAILRATRRLPWPGEAAVVISVVHVIRGTARSSALDGRQVRRISAYLVEGDLDKSPASLAANTGSAFQGMILLGMGFTFDDVAAANGKASPVAEMHRLISKDARNAERIFPYLGGDEVNTDPCHAHRRWCIDFDDYPLRRVATSKKWTIMTESERKTCRACGLVPLDYPGPVAADWPDLLGIVEKLVKPQRDRDKMKSRREKWWLFGGGPAAKLRSEIAKTNKICACLFTSEYMTIAKLQTKTVFANSLNLFFLDVDLYFPILQSSVHELWAREFSSTMEDRLRYSLDQAFGSFPFATDLNVCSELSDAGSAYHDHRAALMVARGEGLTKTFNRFHDADERGPDIARLRKLHHDLDCAVLRAYGWDDLVATAVPEFLTEAAEPDHRYQGRLFWSAAFREEVLGRLLDLNRTRAEEERRLGITVSRSAAEADQELEEA
jgi:hypothetical protein